MLYSCTCHAINCKSRNPTLLYSSRKRALSSSLTSSWGGLVLCLCWWGKSSQLCTIVTQSVCSGPAARELRWLIDLSTGLFLNAWTRLIRGPSICWKSWALLIKVTRRWLMPSPWIVKVPLLTGLVTDNDDCLVVTVIPRLLAQPSPQCEYSTQ